MIGRPNCPKCGKPMQRGNSKPKRWMCRSRRTGYCYSTAEENPIKVRSSDGTGRVVTPTKQPIFERELGGVTRFLITAAQNATPVHAGFIKSLEVAANSANAEIIVIPFRYKNPTSRWTASQENAEEWASEVQPYLCSQRKNLGDHLAMLGDVKTQPTAVNPLAGFEAMTHGESAILGHTKLALKTVATPQNRYAKIITTTGACTVPNYTDSKVGKLGEFHHTLGACVVELHGKKFHLRQINAQRATGEFIDIRDHFTPAGRKNADRARALVMGDTHRDRILPQVEWATFGRSGMVEVLQPRTLVWHDLDDNLSCNPHERGDVFATIARIRSGRADVRAELERSLEYVVRHTPADCRSVIVPSNHNEFITRWIKQTNPHTEPGNFEFWCETAAAMAKSAKVDLTGATYTDAFTYWAKRMLVGQSNIIVLERGQSYTVAGIELGMHLDKGPNGARGSLQNLCRIGVKFIGGHGHGPGIREGGMQVGTSTGPQRYGLGSPSGWLNTHGSIDALGKRSLLNIVDGEWRA